MPPRVIPEQRAKHYADKGLAPAAIRDALEGEGYRGITALAVSLWMRRRGYKRQEKARYADTLPWKLLPEHRDLYPAKMLRRLGRKRAGATLTEAQAIELERFLTKLRRMNAVVHYDPETDEGFWLITREPQDVDVIRRPSQAA